MLKIPGKNMQKPTNLSQKIRGKNIQKIMVREEQAEGLPACIIT